MAFTAVATVRAALTNQVAPDFQRLNVVLIVADDLGYGDLGCYGQTQFKTPNIDAMAAEGARFTQYYAASPVCDASACSLMTGLDMGHASVRGGADVALKPNDLTVAEVLFAKGYRTCLIGKWGLGGRDTRSTPRQRGFSEYVGFLSSVRALDIFPDYVDRFDPRNPDMEKTMIFENMNGGKGKPVLDVFNASIANFVRIAKPDRFNLFRPFFLYLPCTLPHAGRDGAAISKLDATVGMVISELKKYKIDENTIVIFTSDGGPFPSGSVDVQSKSAGMFRGGKGDLYEGGIRVPMIVRWPARIQPGRVSDQVWASWDILPTLAAISGAKIPEKIDGISMLPALMGYPQTNQHDHLYWESHEHGFQQAIRMDGWKGLRTAASAPLELYDLAKDPAEAKNVASEQPDVVAKLEKALKSARTDSEAFPAGK